MMIDGITNIEHVGGGYFDIRFNDSSKSIGLHLVHRVDGRKLLSFGSLMEWIDSEFSWYGEDGSRMPSRAAIKESWEKWLPGIRAIIHQVDSDKLGA